MEIQFPYEKSEKVEIQEELSDFFDLARRLLGFWLRSDKNTGFERSTFAPIVLRVALSMSIKACRQFRTAIELCERGEAADASIISRSMFETAMVNAFVLRPSFRPRKFKDGKPVKEIKVSGVKLTREFRALLYATHCMLSDERFAERYGNRPGLKRIARRRKKLSDLSDLAMYKNIIGESWTNKLLSYPFTYSGLSIEHLALSLGDVFPRWYAMIYGLQSENVHASDVLHHIKIAETGDTTPRWQNLNSEIYETLLTAITMFYATIGIMSEHFEFGDEFETAFSDFSVEYHKLIRAQ